MLELMDKDVTIALRVSKDEQAAWQAAADADGRKLSDWIRRRCNGLESTLPAPFNESDPEVQARVRAGLRVGRYPTDKEVKTEMNKNDQRRVSRTKKRPSHGQT